MTNPFIYHEPASSGCAAGTRLRNLFEALNIKALDDEVRNLLFFVKTIKKSDIC